MLFNSYPFLFLFLPITLVVFFRLGMFSRRLAATWLTASSLLFYSFWNPAYLILLALSIFFNYSVGVGLVRYFDRGAKEHVSRLLFLGISINLLVLIYFKYAGFLVENLNSLTGWQWSLGQIILPLGISFFTFTQIAFLVDASRGLARELNFIHYGLFVTYFPHLIAGPVLHHGEMMPQFARRETYRLSLENLAIGSAVFAIGLFKKTVLADGIAVYVPWGFTEAAHGEALTFFDAWGSALAYTFQLYFDFSGYSDMAVGLSWLFGVKLPLNFNSPYKSWSIIEFWRRWHMTLSRFLRDYLYIPLGGNRLGPARRYLNLFITMVLGGIWHGAGWTYMFWGALHGFYLIVNHAWHSLEEYSKGRIALGRAPATFITFVAVVVGWVFFRSANFSAAVAMLEGMAGLNGVALPTVLMSQHDGIGQWLGGLGVQTMLGGGSRFVGTYGWVIALAGIAFLAPNTQTIVPMISPSVRSGKSSADLESDSKRFHWRPTPQWAVGLGFATALGILAMNQVSEFLYFQF